jgi:hypothetical protein
MEGSMRYLLLAVVPTAVCLVVLCGPLGCGCGCSEPERGSTGVSLRVKSGVSVPDDCRQWLGSFLEAFNSRDGARILELTASRDVAEHMARAPEATRKSMADSATKNVQRLSQDLGEVKSCSVESCKESTLTKDSQPPGWMGVGRYIDIQGEAKCSKRDAKVSFKLYKKADSSDPIMGVWNFTWSPL